MCVLWCAQQGHVAKEWIQEVKFNADGSTFAVGSHDNKVYLYDVRGGRYVYSFVSVLIIPTL
jgi:WD40 repeat protein